MCVCVCVFLWWETNIFCSRTVEKNSVYTSSTQRKGCAY